MFISQCLSLNKAMTATTRSPNVQFSCPVSFYDLSVFQNYYFRALHIPSSPAHIFYQTTIWRIKAWNILGRKTGSICRGEY